MNTVSLPLSRLERDLKMAGMSESTVQQYVASIRGFEEFLGREADQASQDEIRNWVEHLQGQSLSAARLRCHYSALIFLFRKTLGQPSMVAFISMPKSHAPLRIILEPEEVKRVLESVECIKYRTFFTLIYGTGLRINEAIQLETTDVMGEQNLILVRHGKGGRERLVPLNRMLYRQLRACWAQERPTKPFLFSNSKGNLLSQATARTALLKASAISGIGKVVTPHLLRHAFATHLHRQDVDVRTIQVILGHGSIKSTAIYTHISPKEIAAVQSPLEKLFE